MPKKKTTKETTADMPKKKKKTPTKPPKKVKVSKEAKQLFSAIDTICQETGSSIDLPPPWSSPLSCISTGSLMLDLMTSGGYSSGREYTHAGPTQAGKSTMLQLNIAAAQRQNVRVFHGDPEHGGEQRYASANGIRFNHMLPDGERSYVPLEAPDGDTLYKIILRILKSLPSVVDSKQPPANLFVIDSYKSMQPAGVTENSQPLGADARMHSTWQPMIKTQLRRTGSALVASNQVRVRGIGTFMCREDESAGNSLKHYPDFRTFMWSGGYGATQKGYGKCPPRVRPVTIRVARSRLADNEGLKGMFRLSSGRGYDPLHDRLTFLYTLGNVQKDGKYFVVDGKKLQYKAARAVMKDPAYKKLCRKLVRSEKTYVEFYVQDETGKE